MELKYRIGLVAVVTLLLAVFFLYRGKDTYVQQRVEPYIGAIEKKYGLTIRYETITWKEANVIALTGLSIAGEGMEPFVNARTLAIELDPDSLLRKQTAIAGIDAEQLSIRVSKRGGRSNIQFLRGRLPAEMNDALPPEAGFDQKAGQWLKALYAIRFPWKMSLREVDLSYTNDTDDYHVFLPTLLLDRQQLTAEVEQYADGHPNRWTLKAYFRDRQQQLGVRLYAGKGQPVDLPFLRDRWGASVRLDTLALELRSRRTPEGVLTLRGQAALKGASVWQERLSADTVGLRSAYLNYNIEVGRDYITFDKGTQAWVNRLSFRPYLKLEKKADWRITASVDKDGISAADFFASLPPGLFRNLIGMEASGTLAYHFLLDVDLARPERLKFHSSLRPKDLAIVRYGQTDISRMSRPFLQQIYDDGLLVRSFIVGPGNPQFRTYRQISRYLPLAIMHAEDFGFYQHRGFLDETIHRSLVQDIKDRRFSRGGSTLSMQVVKNVFLNHDKTLARKLEEILIVWLIENERLTTKQRMFEVYMNIIEWGPGVYGATEAARYYFGKDPSALSLSECIFLGSIISSPKHVKYRFRGLQIRPSFYPFHANALYRLYQRNMITAAERAAADPHIRITGPAARYLLED